MSKVALGVVIGVLLVPLSSRARPPVPPTVFKAVRASFPTRPLRVQAFDVAYCESRYSIYATNGQYLGLFQFGEWARSTYGFGWDAYSQARAAYRYYRESGWSGWECKPRWS